jgi:hypothetical protein
MASDARHDRQRVAQRLVAGKPAGLCEQGWMHPDLLSHSSPSWRDSKAICQVPLAIRINIITGVSMVKVDCRCSSFDRLAGQGW